MAIAGIVSPTAGYPPGCDGPAAAGRSDEQADLELMLTPLRSLPEVRGLLPDVGDYVGPGSRAIEATVELELDPDTPHLDFIGQLTRLVCRVAETRGVVLPLSLVARLERTAAHARCVSEALGAIRARRSSHGL